MTDEETAALPKPGTVEEFAALLAKAEAEGREKGKPFEKSRGMRLWGLLPTAIVLCCLASFAWSALAWLLHRIP